jgi:hypothetical protein
VEWLVAAYLKYTPPEAPPEVDIAAAFGLRPGQKIVG